jgi:hypothetical protein
VEHHSLGGFIPHVQIAVVYIDAAGGAVVNEDAFFDWVLTSSYWALLGQYGVGSGSVVPSTRVPASTWFTSAELAAGTVDVYSLNDAIRAHARCTTVTTGCLPSAEAYVVFLPDGLNAVAPDGSVTCSGLMDYHAYSGDQPYTVIGSCPLARSPYGVSHELVEMVTDSLPGFGWFTAEGDANGEIADVCNDLTGVTVGGWQVSRFWSDHANGCVP